MRIDKKIITQFLYGLRRESGGYAESMDGEHSIRSTLSVIKTLIEIGEISTESPAALPWAIDFILACRDGSGGFAIKPGDAPTAYDTANGLIGLQNMGRTDLLSEFLPRGIAFMSNAAQTQFDHFMLIAAYEECGVKTPVPEKSVEFFTERLKDSLKDKKIADTAIAAASLIRAGQKLPDEQEVASLLLSGQNSGGGFNEIGNEGPSLFTTYCVLRTLVLLGKLPDTKRLVSWLGSLETSLGYTDTPDGKTTAGAVYMNIGMQSWIKKQQNIPVEMARKGDIQALEKWLSAGGEANLYDDEGWTPLLAASARGQAACVDFLLNHGNADPDMRFIEADALPIYLAGQNGDLETIRCLLKAKPGHLHETCGINGHTVLLQTSFYGKEKHLETAEYLLENAAEIAGLPPEKKESEQEKLLAATNVRGYNALQMQELWHNEKMKTLLSRYYPEKADSEKSQRIEESRKQYYEDLLLKIASPQALTEKLISEIYAYVVDGGEDMRIDTLLSMPQLNIDLPGGELLMTPLIFTLTGKDENEPERARRRYKTAKKLLDAGASVAAREKHPMAVGAVIRASVLGNFELLKLLSEYMTPESFADELNKSPAVNGLTAMHDAVHRTLTSTQSGIDARISQIQWMIGCGARMDIEDHTGQTAFQLAEAALKDSAFSKENSEKVFDILRSGNYCR